MAAQTMTYDYQHVIGNMREDFGRWTSSDTDGTCQTRLKWIYQVEIMSPGAALQHIEVHPNSEESDEEDNILYGGKFYYNGSSSDEALRYRAVGI